MKKFLLIILIFLFGGVMGAGAETIGDIDDDGLVGLPEAVHALQVTAGIRSQSVAPTYDLAEYFLVDGDFLYKANSRNAPFQPIGRGNELQSIYHKDVEGIDVLVREVKTGLTPGLEIYYKIEPTQVEEIGDYYPPDGSVIWYTPRVVLGSRNMKKGDVFTNFYERNGFGLYRENIFFGLEDVTVPAGNFKDCLKIVQKYFTYANYGSYLDVSAAYYAKNIGMVKYATSLYALELSYAHIGDVKYGEAILCTGQGSWIENNAGVPTGQSGTFSFSFDRLENPIFTTLSMDYDLYTSNYYLVSNDGINFALNPDIYSDFYLQLQFTLDNGDIIGTNTGIGNEIIVTGTYTCTE